MSNSMKAINYFLSLWVRFRYPVSLPEDVADALGIEMHNSMRFKELLHELTNMHHPCSRLNKFMSRELAERCFLHALRKERFPQSSLFSFYFNEGWLEFELQFDPESRLRRLYVHHKLLSYPSGYELSLPCKSGLINSNGCRILA